MRTRNIFIIAILGLAFTACSQESFVGTTEQIDPGPGGLTAIDFGSNAKARTRATHEESAALLGGKFLLYGTKTKDAVESPVFDNYWVEYNANTAGNTLSNSSDWEYSGLVSKKGAVQAVKYWDYSAQRFDFVAFSGLASNELITSTKKRKKNLVKDGFL